MLLLTHSFGFEPSLKDDLNVFLRESFWHGATQQALNTDLLFFVCTICGFVRLGHTSQLSQSDTVLTGDRAADYRENPWEKTAHHTQHVSCIKLNRGGNFAEFQRWSLTSKSGRFAVFLTLTHILGNMNPRNAQTQIRLSTTQVFTTCFDRHK